MSSFKNANKASQKTHRERSQPEARAHLGILPKKKDYQERALQFHKKEKAIKALQLKAADKNPDEFYFKMVNTSMKEGVHQTKESETPTYTDDQQKLMCTQDIKYVNFRLSMERKKIAALKATLHLIETNTANKHKIFVENRSQVKNFDSAKYFDTDESLMLNSNNRPRVGDLADQVTEYIDDETIAQFAVDRNKRYKELAKRIGREKQLVIIAEKMTLKTHLLNKKERRTKIEDETKESAAVYKFGKQRKR